MKPIYLIFHLLLCLSHSMMSQNKETDTLYIKYDKNFNIRESLVAENRDVKLSFSVFSKEDVKTTTYNFIVDNINEKFENLSFEDIRKNVVESNFKGKIFSREDFIKFHPCDLHFLFSDSKNIFLLKEEDEKLIRYKLTYWSTQRGWEDVKNN